MPHALVNYDINTRHSEVKREMIAIGYDDSFTETQGSPIHYLPNTTLVKINTSLAQGKSDIHNVIAALNRNVVGNRIIVLERLIVTDINPHEAIRGIPHAQ